MNQEIQNHLIPITKADFLNRLRTKINQNKAGHRQWWLSQSNRLDYSYVQIKENKILIQKHFMERNSMARGLAGAVVEIKDLTDKIELTAKVYVDDATRNFFKYFLAIFVLACSITIQFIEFKILTIFITIGIELV